MNWLMCPSPAIPLALSTTGLPWLSKEHKQDGQKPILLTRQEGPPSFGAYELKIDLYILSYTDI